MCSILLLVRVRWPSSMCEPKRKHHPVQCLTASCARTALSSRLTCTATAAPSPRTTRVPHDRALIRCKRHLVSDALLVLDTFALPLARGTGARGGAARLPLFGVAHSLGSAVLTFVEKKRPGTFAVRLDTFCAAARARLAATGLGLPASDLSVLICWLAVEWQGHLALMGAKTRVTVWFALSFAAIVLCAEQLLRCARRHRYLYHSALLLRDCAAAQGLAMNAPALGRKVTIFDRILLWVVSWFAMIIPRTPLVPGTPWEQLSDEPDLIAGIVQDKLFSNGDIRAQTAMTLGQVRAHVAQLAKQLATPDLFSTVCVCSCTLLTSMRATKITSARPRKRWTPRRGCCIAIAVIASQDLCAVHSSAHQIQVWSKCADLCSS